MGRLGRQAINLNLRTQVKAEETASCGQGDSRSQPPDTNARLPQHAWETALTDMIKTTRTGPNTEQHGQPECDSFASDSSFFFLGVVFYTKLISRKICLYPTIPTNSHRSKTVFFFFLNWGFCPLGRQNKSSSLLQLFCNPLKKFNNCGF